MRTLRDLIAAIVAAFTGLFRTSSEATGDRTDQVGPDQVGPDQVGGRIVNGAFRDRARQRVIPFRLYTPDQSREQAARPAPVMLFSHGLGGSRDAMPLLGQELARNGYFAFFLQHPGSDDSLLEGATTPEEVQDRLQQAVQIPGIAMNRFRDIPAVLDQLVVMNSKGRLAGRLDLDRIGMAGHSFGARGVMTAAGQRTGGHGIRYKEPRIKAGVVISPNVPTTPGSGPAQNVGPAQNLDALYDMIDIPLLHITGTEDGMPGGGAGAGAGFDPATRTLPFQHIQQPDQYLLVLDGATHNSFGGRPAGDDTDSVEAELAEVVGLAVAVAVVLFFDAYLKADSGARRTLREDFRRSLAQGDRFEVK